MKNEKLNKNFEQYLLNVLMDNIPDSIFFKDLESRFIKINKGTIKKFGLTSDENIIGKTDHDIFKPEHAKVAREDEQYIIKTGKPIINKEVDELWQDGTVTWASVTKAPLKDNEGNIIGTFGLTRDITELKRKEEAIKNYAKELEIKNKLIEKNAEVLKSLNNKLSESEIQLKQSVNTKDKFFSIISHDLRGPFTSMLGMLEFLIRDIDEMSKEEIKEFAASVHSSSQSVYKLVENLLEWSRVQTGRIKKEPEKILMNEIIEDILKLCKPGADKKGIEFKTEMDNNLFVLADRNMIDTIIRNLVLNAIKFSFEKGKIEIKTKLAKEQVIVGVCDSGTGISKDDLKDLFKIDKHISRPGTAMEQGTGLGLILCKEFVENNGGKIWVESREGKGSAFYFSLPLYKSP